MSDEEDNAFDVEDYNKLKKEVESWKAKCKSMELKKREAELALNKIKTEINSLRSVDKLWKDSAKTVYLNLNDVKKSLDVQVDQILDGLTAVSKGGERVTEKSSHLRSVKRVIAQLQHTISSQSETIAGLNSRIRGLTAELKEKTDKCERLSAGIEEEVERLIKPMREKLSETVVALMKEKASRAQERREIADLWPKDFLMPTLLMRYRTLSLDENERRVQYAIEQNASLALSLEVRANVVESQMWEIKYDDYGRPFYQHMKTGQKSEEPPEIMSYQPPLGRDESGNVITTEENDSHNWLVLADTRGQVYYKNKLNGTITYYPPYAYKKLPPGKTRDQTVAEAAGIVLDFMKEKISKHIAMKKKRKEDLENPLTPEERKKKEKADKNRTPEEIAAAGPELSEEGEPIDLTLYQYDIETVEMLAHELTGESNTADKDMEEIRKERRSFLEGKEVRKFQEELFEGQSIIEMEINSLSVPEIRGIVEELSLTEEKYETKLERTRNNLKDFSFLLQERLTLDQEEKLKALRDEKIQHEKEIKHQQRQILNEKKAKLKERKDLIAKEQAQRLLEAQNRRDQMMEDEESRLTDDQSHLLDGGESKDNVEETSDNRITEKKPENHFPAAPTITEEEEGADEVKGDQEENNSPISKHTDEENPQQVEGVIENVRLSKVSIVMPLEEEEREIEELERTVDKAIVPVPDEDLSKEIYGDKVFMLFGEMTVNQEEYDCSEEILQLCNNLANFTLFSGFMNLKASDYPYEANANYSLLEEEIIRQENQNNPDYHSTIPKDDDWLTCHFFLGCTREQLDKHQELLRKEYSSSTGLLPIGPMDTEKILFYSRTTAEVSRTADHSYTPLTRSTTENVIANQHLLWKNQQLMNDVIKYQLQQNAIKSLLTHRIKAFEDPAVISFETLNPSVVFDFTNMKLKLAQKPSSIKNNIYTIQFSIGSCTQKSKGIVLTPTELLEWYEDQVHGELNVNRLQVDELVIEIIDENPESLERFVVGKGSTSIHEILGYNLGRNVPFEVNLKKIGRRRGSLMLERRDSVKTIKSAKESDHQPTEEGESVTIGNVDDEDEEENIEDPTLALKKRKKSVVDPTKFGSLLFDLKGVVEYRTVIITPTDPTEQENYNDIHPLVNEKDEKFKDKRKVTPSKSIDIYTNIGQYSLKCPDPETAEVGAHQHTKQFRLLISELRGDIWNLTKKLTGDYPIKMILRDSPSADDGFPDEKTTSYHPNQSQELYSLHTNLSPAQFSYQQQQSRQNQQVKQTVIPLKTLPNFNNASNFLKKKYSIHEHKINKLLSDIKERMSVLTDLMKTKMESLNRTIYENKLKLKRQLDSVEDIQKDVQKYNKITVDLRKPNPEPKEPIFQELPPIPYVPQLPQSGGLDNRGKKKKALLPNDLKALLEDLEIGKMDGEEIWTLPENYFPSQAQIIKINKGIESRNSVLDEKRKSELQARERTLDTYQQEKEKWELIEKRRHNELERSKKDCRRANIKYDCAMQKLQRMQEENNHIEFDLKNVQDLKLLQDKSINAFKVIRLKQFYEKERQINFITTLKNRLLRAINARKFALNYPTTAMDQFSYEDYCRKSEESLRFVKYEIYECKYLLLQEGIRLRKFLNEEEHYLMNEFSRICLSLEIITQRDLFDNIIVRYKTEIISYFTEIEKHKLLETDADEVGIETIDDLGERYIPTKTWTSPAVNKIQRIIDLHLAKIKITENYGRSANAGQRYLIDILIKQYSENFFILKDSWIEISDYERSQQVLSDTVQYITTMRQFIQEQSKEIQEPLQELSLVNSLVENRIQDSLHLHEKETLNLKNSSVITLNATRKYLEEYRAGSEKKIAHLEFSIIELSRECQKIREELLSQQMIYDDKMKVLWAFIHTLQTALQQLSARMEIVLEEREKIVIESRLMADNTRHQLRLERKHCSNLLFIIHSQKGFIFYLKQIINKLKNEQFQQEQQQNAQRNELKRDVWETIFTFTRLCTDVDLLFEFFTSRLANLSGSRDSINNQLAKNNAAMVLAALCKNPRPIIKRNAARALGNLGWNSFVETRILLWDCMMYWKSLKKKILTKEKGEFELTLDKFTENGGKYDAILSATISEIEEFIPTGNLSLRSLIKQRRQWALRAARRVEGPNYENQKLLNIKDGVLISLLEICVSDGGVDWEISRNAALAISIASYEISNHYDMIHNDLCRQMIIQMCQSNDAEVQTHAAITIANLSYKDETAQMTFGQNGVIPILIEMLTSTTADVLESSTAALANLTCYSDYNCLQVIEYHGIQKLISIIVYSYSENLLDLDQNDEVHANAAETLANISRFNTKESIKYFLANAIQANNNQKQLPSTTALTSAVAPSSSVIDALVIMAASSNKQLRRHISLVIGNIAQNETIREEIGNKGGIEALFLTVEDSDVIVQSNALWALANLMWYPPNQERAGRFMKDIVHFIYYDFTRNTGVAMNNNNVIGKNNNTHTLAIGEADMDGLKEEKDSGKDKSPINKNRKQSTRQQPSKPNQEIKEKDSENKNPEYRELQVIKLLQKNHHSEQVVINSTMLLGNVLYYNSNNRVRFLEVDYSFEILLLYIANRQFIHVQIIESVLRSLLSLSYLDSIALFFGTEEFVTDSSNLNEMINKHLELNKTKKPKKLIPLLISYLHKPYYSRSSMRYALEILCNLCLHHLNRQIIYDYDGIDAIVALHTDEDEKIRELSMKIIDYLEDITPKEILAKRKALIGLERMVNLMTNQDPLVRTVAAEAIGEEIWNAHQNNHLSLQDTSDPFYNVQKKPTQTIQEKQKIAHEIGAIDSLLANIHLCNQHFDQFIIQSQQFEEEDEIKQYNQDQEGRITHEIIHQDIQLLLPALWSLRNTIHQYYPGQMQFYFCNGIQIISQLIRNINTGFYQRETEKLLESSISCLIGAISNSHEKNSRKLVMVGLDAILDLTKESTILKSYQKGLFKNDPSNNVQYVLQAIQSEGLQALVNALLLALGPFNYVVCKNCQRKQDLHGTSCFYCGHRLIVDVEGLPPLQSTIETQNIIRTSQSAKELPWRHAGKAVQLTPLQPSPTMGHLGAAVTTGNPLKEGGAANKGKSYFSRTLPGQLGDGGAGHINRPKT
jgi:predicted  nucleic acid-binding Zn-ribbon protein